MWVSSKRPVDASSHREAGYHRALTAVMRKKQKRGEIKVRMRNRGGERGEEWASQGAAQEKARSVAKPALCD